MQQNLIDQPTISGFIPCRVEPHLRLAWGGEWLRDWEGDDEKEQERGRERDEMEPKEMEWDGEQDEDPEKERCRVYRVLLWQQSSIIAEALVDGITTPCIITEAIAGEEPNKVMTVKIFKSWDFVVLSHDE